MTTTHHFNCHVPGSNNNKNNNTKTIYRIYSCIYALVDALVWKHATKDISDEQEQSASLFQECILLRNNVLTLPEIFNVTDIERIISEVCSMN